MTTRAPELDVSGLDRFESLWRSPPGFRGWLATVNNQPLGLRFMITALAFFLIGGVMGLLLRIQLAVSDNTFLGPDAYNELFTMHGSTMMYLFAVPFLEGLAVYLVPMLVGSRDLAFPRLTAFGYWAYLFGGLTMYASFFVGTVPDAGWFAYTPLSGSRYSGMGLDFWVLGLGLVEVAGITAGIEIVITILKLRAPGMSIERLPLYIWAMLAAGLMIIFAFTTLLTATILLELDRTVGTRFFDPDHGGSSLLWQHLFWFFGHPEVYIIFIPATGIVSAIVTTFARRIIGYILIAAAIVVTAFVSFGLWVHHMYTTGLPLLAMNFFAASSLMIAIASATQVFAWIATLWGRRPAMTTPMLYIIGFIILFVLGGLTGIMIAVVPFDWQVHDTFFIVAHFHYVLIGGAVFPMLAGLHYWWPKVTGRMFSERLGHWSFWLSFIGFNLTFFPMHIMGLLGMPRRVYTYPAELKLDGYNLAATAGSFVLGIGFLLVLANLMRSFWRGKAAGADPWKADTLEWSIASPPPIYTFHRPPVVTDRHPLWAERSAPTDPAAERAVRALAGRPLEWRATLATDSVYARPQSIHYLPGPSAYPLLLAASLLIASVAVIGKNVELTVLGAVASIGFMLHWLWPRPEVAQRLLESTVPQEAGLPVITHGPRSINWWGAVSAVAVFATAGGALLYSYFYIRLYSPQWPQGDAALPALAAPAAAFAVLIASAAPLVWATSSFRTAHRAKAAMALAATAGAGLVFLVLHTGILLCAGLGPRDSAYASLFLVIGGFLNITVLVGVALTGAAIGSVRRGYGGRDGPAALHVQIAAMFWWFVLVAAAAVFATIYISPHVI